MPDQKYRQFFNNENLNSSLYALDTKIILCYDTFVRLQIIKCKVLFVVKKECDIMKIQNLGHAKKLAKGIALLTSPLALLSSIQAYADDVKHPESSKTDSQKITKIDTKINEKSSKKAVEASLLSLEEFDKLEKTEQKSEYYEEVYESTKKLCDSVLKKYKKETEKSHYKTRKELAEVASKMFPENKNVDNIYQYEYERLIRMTKFVRAQKFTEDELASVETEIKSISDDLNDLNDLNNIPQDLNTSVPETLVETLTKKFNMSRPYLVDFLKDPYSKMKKNLQETLKLFTEDGDAEIRRKIEKTLESPEKLKTLVEANVKDVKNYFKDPTGYVKDFAEAIMKNKNNEYVKQVVPDSDVINKLHANYEKLLEINKKLASIDSRFGGSDNISNEKDTKKEDNKNPVSK